jgi:hypothetical protein
LEDILSAIDQAAANDYKVVVFTGGEATLAGKDLLRGIERAVSHDLSVRIVTNAHWAVNDKGAERRVAEFVRAGLKEINFSTGDQHTRFVPIERVIRATRAAVRAGLQVSIMVETLKERRVTQETVENHPEFRRIRQDYPLTGINVHESPWMPLSPSIVHKYPDGIAANKTNLASFKGCDSVLSTTTVQADGRIAACCGLGMRLIPELQLGDVQDTELADAQQKAENDFLKRWIRAEGPERILDWASTHDPEIEWEDMYAHRCQACLRLYKDPKVRDVIAKHHKEKIADVLVTEWLLFHYQSNQDGDDTQA